MANMTVAGAGHHRRADVQGLRAVAVVAVILNHLCRWPSGGFVGVDVFFVLSGYLITGLLVGEQERTGRISFKGFYVRRARRILPAAVVVLAATVAAAHQLLGSHRIASVDKDSVWALLFSANVHFARVGTDYFQQGLPPSPVQHFWSLAVEEQFYVVWPAVLLLVLSRGGTHARRRLWAVAGVAVVGSFLYGLHQTSVTPTVAYFSTPSRAWELGIGALVALSPGLVRASRPVRSALAWAGLAGIVVSLFVVPQSPGFPVPWALLPVLATAAVVLAGHRAEAVRVPALTNRVAGYLGDISYSLYLWHFPVIVLLVALLPSDSAAYYAWAGVGTLALAAASFHLFEDPVRRGRRPDWARGSVLYARPTVVAVAAGFAALVVAGLVVHRAPVNQVQSASAPLAPCLGAGLTDPANHCDPALLGSVVRPDPQDAASDTGDAFDCWTAQAAPLRTCTYGSTSPDATRVALVGDSHAAMLLPGLIPQLVANDWRLDTYVGFGCDWRPEGPQGCAAMTAIQQRLLTGPAYAVVLTTAARSKSPKATEQVADAYDAEWAPVEARGSRVVVIADNPEVSNDSLECVQRATFSVRDSTCSTSLADARRDADPLVDAAEDLHGTRLVDLTSVFCSRSGCPAVIGHVVVYRDLDDHITATFSRTLGPDLVAGIRRAAR